MFLYTCVKYLIFRCYPAVQQSYAYRYVTVVTNKNVDKTVKINYKNEYNINRFGFIKLIQEFNLYLKSKILKI
jgi:hypothetical protein